MNRTKLNKGAFEPLFGDWWPKIEPFFDSGGMDVIYEHLKFESQRGKKLAPLSHNVYRCFIETPLKDLKLVMMGMAPYHTFKNYMPVADGLLFGCSTTGKLQPSLQLFYDEIERSVYKGLSLEGEKSPDVSFLAHQGILMLNASLTTEMNKAVSHLELWKPFIKYIFEEILSIERVPIIFLGKNAYRFKKYIPIMLQTFEVNHPASAAYRNEEWDSGGVFLAVNKLIKEYNNYEIDWLKFEELPF